VGEGCPRATVEVNSERGEKGVLKEGKGNSGVLGGKLMEEILHRGGTGILGRARIKKRRELKSRQRRREGLAG